MSPTHTRRRGRLYRYYISQAVLKRGKDACPVGRVSASEIEAAVVAQLRGLLSSPEVIVATWRSAPKDLKGLREQDVRERLVQFAPLWDQLFPAEQARIVQLLVERIDLTPAGLDLSLRVEGLSSFVSELQGGTGQHTRAA